MRRTLITTFVLLVGAATFAGATAGRSVAAPSLGGFEVVDLTPAVSAEDGGFGQALGLTLRGAVVGAATDDAGNLEAALWNEAIVPLGTLGGSTSSAHDGNEHGDVAGESLIDGDAATHAFLWRDGVMLDLGTLGGLSSWARGVDRRRTVVGGAERADGAVHAFAWHDGTMTDLGTLGGTTSWADAIGVRGEIVGNAAVTGDSAIHATMWLNGVAGDLGTLGGASSAARDVSSSGDVAGWSERADGSTHAAVWSSAGRLDLGTLGGSFSSANGINRRGQVVGVSTLEGDAASRAFLWDGKRMHALDSLLPAGSDWSIVEAFAIDDKGRIAAQAVREGAVHAVLLTPTR